MKTEMGVFSEHGVDTITTYLISDERIPALHLSIIKISHCE